jgi:hypothetical protein
VKPRNIATSLKILYTTGREHSYIFPEGTFSIAETGQTETKNKTPLMIYTETVIFCFVLLVLSLAPRQGHDEIPASTEEQILDNYRPFPGVCYHYAINSECKYSADCM